MKAETQLRQDSFQLDEPEPEEPGMLMTSMIDIIFILLAFFVCVSEVKKGVLHVDVPEVSDVDSPTPQDVEPLAVEITAKNEIYVGGKHARDIPALAELIRARASEVGERVGDVPVHIAGDKDARNGTTMKVMGQLSKAGFRKFEFAVEGGGG